MAGGCLQGKLIRYGRKSAHTAFISGSGSRHAILVGGLSDGMLFAAYCQPLIERLQAAGWTCVQPLLSSSLSGWGLAKLDEDAAEICRLAKILATEHGAEGIAIIGHSTGCQDAVRYATLYPGGGEGVPRLLGVVLQAPVSDREFLDQQPSTPHLLRKTRELIAAGRAEDLVGRVEALGGTPVTARRFAALALPGGDDDMFSSDLSDDELKDLLKGLTSIPSLFVLGLADDCYQQDCDIEELGRRMVAAAGPRAQLAVLPGCHSQLGYEKEFVDIVSDFLAGVA